ncbi:uncharacterized protein LOC113519259 isoform X1 [Galleria mellonella]|uniref:Uncharacterized protein LOC113519259 isoform X1 n=1 Tax=Galleria mellonella TaxID=7137 RepID=A0ABM3ME78_GALME|nr:uncharacterized protein LOC113519259 isoform X1 [Galleria mellonella]XP_052749441.1 uncharacterized protein LOC113519259 isoform X1 [Galleria mellonella]XP_052749442.1 uncharacterized protein LOC113519259 isoform X1 [Galleria mellonella]XP_052749443.1 uncharacterized protein LOC113519259 isoform X1 [Galleria mellonella]
MSSLERSPYNNMVDTDAEIEFLDEDADIVQQCVQSTIVPEEEDKEYLVERAPERPKRRRKVEDEDSDYDPRDEVPSPVPKMKKKKHARKPEKVNTIHGKSTVLPKSIYTTTLTHINRPKVLVQSNAPSKINIFKTKTIDLNTRKKMDIKIPDYEDPLCLPVRAIKENDSDVKKLRIWNNACLQHFKHCDNILKPESGVTKGSTRSIVLRNIVNKATGNSETAIWSKTSVENENGVRKSQIFQSILPRYREKKILDSYELQNIKVPRNCHHVDEVLLTKEESKNGDILVAYKPKEAITSVYKFTDDGDNESESADVEARKCLREVACCRTCAPCYQTSWRATRRDNAKMKIRCPVCGRGWPSAYSLLTHLRSHPGPQLQRHRAAVHHELARILDYHYRCRVCQHTFTSIKCLRAHVASHKGTETFTCEIGNHVAS